MQNKSANGAKVPRIVPLSEVADSLGLTIHQFLHLHSIDPEAPKIIKLGFSPNSPRGVVEDDLLRYRKALIERAPVVRSEVSDRARNAANVRWAKHRASLANAPTAEAITS